MYFRNDVLKFGEIVSEGEIFLVGESRQWCRDSARLEGIEDCK
jgi:hypothetical protein